MVAGRLPSDPAIDGDIHIGDNHFGEGAPPSCDFGAPREGCPAP